LQNRACRRGVWSYSFSSHKNAFDQGEKLCRISDETATIKTLKETKKKLKESVQNFTELIDRRIDTIQDANREIRYEKTSDWLKERGF
jgi:gas vesicle protein